MANSRNSEIGGFTCTDDQDKALALIAAQQRYTLLFGGSRSGKTALFCLAMACRGLIAPNTRHLILRAKLNHLKASVWHDTWPKVWKLAFPGVGYKENKSDMFVTLPNDSQVWFGGLDDKERIEKILGQEYSTVFLNEISQISYLGFTTAITRLAQKSDLKNKIFLDCNPPTKRHWSYKLFYDGVDPETNEPKNKNDYETMLMNPDGNVENIGDDYLLMLEGLPHRQRQRFLLGQWQDDVLGALWKQSEIDENRIPPDDQSFELIRTAVAVDPAITSTEKSDETGIVVGGVDMDRHGYLIADCSGIYTPAGWAREAVKMYHKYDCAYIVAEKNQGGDMVKHTIKSVDSDVPVRLVHATKGKMTRAEPVSGLYEDGKIHHVGYFPDLEEQLTTYVGDPREQSPDRMDANVWLWTSMLLKNTGQTAEGGVEIGAVSSGGSFYDRAVVA